MDWLITNSKRNFDMIVIDELSSFKNHKAKRFKALLKKRSFVKRVVGLTGTPSSNGLMDLWAEFRILDKGERLGRYIGKYREIYFRPDKRNGQIIFSYKPKENAEEEIYKKISDITISMKSDDYLILPKVTSNIINVSLSEKERRIYETLKDELVVDIKDKEIDAKTAATLSNKLVQLSSGAIYDDDKNIIKVHERKLDALEDLIEGANGKPVLIAYWFKHDLLRIKERFEVCELKTSDDFRKWNKGEIPVAIIHPASAGHGLNLQAGGSTLIWFSLTWSLELYQQTNKRLHRQGQKESVVIHHIITKNTIDEKIMKALENKERVQDSLIDAVKADIGGKV